MPPLLRFLLLLYQRAIVSVCLSFCAVFKNHHLCTVYLTPEPTSCLSLAPSREFCSLLYYKPSLQNPLPPPPTPSFRLILPVRAHFPNNFGHNHILANHLQKKHETSDSSSSRLYGPVKQHFETLAIYHSEKNDKKVTKYRKKTRQNEAK